jgi:transposase-like protein
MTIDIRCTVCKYPDKRRLIELGWNDGMAAADLARQFEGLTSAAITKHLKQHSEGLPASRRVDIEPVTPARERVLALQRLQLDEVERRINLAKQRADQLNAVLDELEAAGAEGAAETPRHDWSEFTDILGKDMQAAIGSILKMQGLTDKREKATSELKLGLFDSMLKAGLAPKAISGAISLPQLPPGDPPGAHGEPTQGDDSD